MKQIFIMADCYRMLSVNQKIEAKRNSHGFSDYLDFQKSVMEVMTEEQISAYSEMHLSDFRRFYLNK